MKQDLAIEAAIYEYTPLLQGWSNPGKCCVIAQCIIDNKPALSFEIGMYGGRGLLSMAFGHRHVNHGKAIGIDPWEKKPTQEGTNLTENDIWWAEFYDEGGGERLEAAWNKAVEAHHIGQWVENHRETSKEAISRLTDGSIGFLHQDGNHSEEVSCWEVENYSQKLALGGFWLMDDVQWSSTQKALSYIHEVLKWKIIKQMVTKEEAWILFKKT